MNLAQCPGETNFIAGHDHQVYVVGHQAIAQNPKGVVFRVLFQQTEVYLIIRRGEEDVAPGIATLCNVMRGLRYHDAREPGHALY